jgi:hypothetical protein
MEAQTSRTTNGTGELQMKQAFVHSNQTFFSLRIRMKMEFIYQTLSLKAMQLIHQAPTITVIQPDHQVWI